MNPIHVTLEDIESATKRISKYIRKTPTYALEALGKELLLKCEMLQRTGSFKLRGATNCTLQNYEKAKASGIVAASAGNHAQGVACIAHQLGLESTICMPKPSPTLKIHNTARWGAKIELVGEIYDDAYQFARELAKKTDALFIPAYCDKDVIAGQGTLGLEMADAIAEQQTEAIVIPVGGGGLMCGVATALRARFPKLKIYGVAAKNAPSVWKSYQEKKITVEPVKFTLAEGVATKHPEPQMLSMLAHLVDDFFVLSEEAIAHAVSWLAEEVKLVVEGAGSLPIAAILENKIPEKKVAAVLSGGNIDLQGLSSVLQHGLVEQGRIARLTILLPDRPGALLGITETLAEERANILQIYHQRATLNATIGEAEVEVDIETRGPEHTKLILNKLTEKGYAVKKMR